MRRSIVSRLLLPAICLLATTSILQAQIFQGTSVVRPGHIYNYVSTGGNPVTWTVSGGATIISQSSNLIRIQWNNGLNKFVAANSYTGTQSMTITDAPPILSGVIQPSNGAQYNTPTNVVLNFTTAPVFPYNPELTYSYISYEWFMVSGGNGGSIGTSSSASATVTMTQNNNPPAYFAPFFYCVQTFHEVPMYGPENVTYQVSNYVTMQLALLQPGSLSSPQSTLSMASSPTINQSPATGGMCITADYVYEWFGKKDNNQWEFIGTGLNPPMGVIVSGGSLLTVKRKVTCAGESVYTNELSWNVTPYTSVDYENLNYVRENTVLKPGVKSWEQSDVLAIGDKFQSTTYLDGLGRSIQNVGKGVSSAANNTWKDIVKHYEYDAAGRTPKDFLPYATSDNPGKFKTNAAPAQLSYTTSFFNEPANTPTYSLVEYDNSPLNRVKKSMLPGQSWAGNNKGISGNDEFNNYLEKVHIWTLEYSSAALPASNPSAVYPTGTLLKNTSKDEKENKVITYTDLSGNLILKKVQEETDVQLSLEHDGWVCTYYVYDDFGRLRYTISPKAVKYLNGNGWNFTQTLADKLCYKYIYDKKGRLAIKKQPEAEEIWMVYDERDRLVFSQDGKQRLNKQWMTTLYDALDRPVITGITTLTASILLPAMQTTVSNQTKTPTTPNTGPPADRILSSSHTSGTYQALLSITMLDGFQSATNTEFVAEIVAGSNGSDGETTILESVAIHKNPIPGNADLMVLSIAYYDNYDYPGVKPFNNTYTLAYATTPNIDPIIKTNRTTGMGTGGKIRVLDGDNNNANDRFHFSTAYYDEQGRTIEAIVDNIKNGTDYQVSQYDFAGKLMSSYSSHTPGGSTTYTITTKNEFDKIGRLIKLSKNFNNSFYKQLAEYNYNELGQLKTKRLAPGYTATGANEIELLTYDYNIQGWLTGINKDYALGDNTYTQWERYFGMYLGYDNRDNKFADLQLNGNITGTIWRSQGDNSPRKFDFTYDKLDRFTSALFKQRKKPSETSWSSMEVDFTTNLTYEDGNGNIKSMKHMGIVPGINNGVMMDDLRYSYLPTGITDLNGNQLKQVDDLGTIAVNNNGLLGDFKDANTTQDYYYDVNGNLTKDLNKNIRDNSSDGITYNYMNKPQKIVIHSKSTIEFMYDAGGAKLQKKVSYADNSVRMTSYIGDFVYEQFTPPGGGGLGEQLQYVLHEEGRIKIITAHIKAGDIDYELNAGTSGLNWPGGKQGVFEYFLKDHLSNTRMVLTEEIHKEYYKATMEDGLAVQEAPLFGQVNANGTAAQENELNKTRLENSGSTPTVWPSNNTDVSKLTATASEKVIGPNMVLKVMAGDILTSDVKYYYVGNNSAGPGNLLNTIGNSLVNALTGVQSNTLGKNQGTAISVNFTGNTDLVNLLNQRNGSGISPKAYLNIVFLDEQFKYIDKDPVTTSVGTNFARVNAVGNPAASLTLQQKAPKNGWAFVFLSNESNEIVYFDNLAVIHEHSRISEENHYYPYGLKIAGISSKAVNKLENNYNYQGDYSEKEKETGWDEFYLRMYDPQIGRWTANDPYDIYASPYMGMGNDPINSIDPDGGEPFDWFENLETGKLEYFAGKHVWDCMEGYRWFMQEGPINDPELGQGWGDRFGNFIPLMLGNVFAGGNPMAFFAGYTPVFQAIPERRLYFSQAKPKPPLTVSQAVIAQIFRSNPVVVSADALLHGPINDAYITGKAMFSGMGGYSKSGMTDLFGNVVGYNKRISAGLNTLSMPVMFANPEGQIASEVGSAVNASRRAFHSGVGTEAKALKEGYLTLGQTRAGMNLKQLITTKNIPWIEAKPMWERLSTVWAKGIPKGSTVRAFLNSPDPASIWLNTEKPILIERGVNIIAR